MQKRCNGEDFTSVSFAVESISLIAEIITEDTPDITLPLRKVMAILLCKYLGISHFFMTEKHIYYREQTSVMTNILILRNGINAKEHCFSQLHFQVKNFFNFCLFSSNFL